MAKPLPKKLEKSIRKGMKSVEKTVSNVKPKKGPSTAKVAGVAGAAVAGVAGLAAAVRYLRTGPRDAATLHVRRNSARAWEIAAEGSDEPVATYATKREAVRAARTAAAEAAPSALVIHRMDGSIEHTHSYEAA